MATMGVEILSGSNLPDLYGCITAAGGDVLAIRQPGYRVHGFAMTMVGEDIAPVSYLPYSYFRIAAAACYISTVRGTGDGIYDIGATPRDKDLPPCMNVPHADSMVIASRGDTLPGGRPCNCPNHI